MCRSAHSFRTTHHAHHAPAAHPLSPRHPHPDIPPNRHPARTADIDTLTSRQRAHLRSLAHALKPILQVGVDGVSDAVLRSIEEAFNTRELLKIKVFENAPVDVDQAAAAIAASLPGVHVPQTIGRTLVLYRPFPEDPEIRLPD